MQFWFLTDLIGPSRPYDQWKFTHSVANVLFNSLASGLVLPFQEMFISLSDTN